MLHFALYTSASGYFYYLSHILRVFPFFKFRFNELNHYLVTTFISEIPTALFHFTDPRVADWFLVGSPLYPLGLITLYLYVVKFAGPRYMKNRPAYQLTGIISAYNITQIFLNAFLFIKVSTWNSITPQYLNITNSCLFSHYAVLLKYISHTHVSSSCV